MRDADATTTQHNLRPAARSGTFAIGGDLPVHRLGFGAMRITGKGIWGEPRDHDEAIAVLRRAVELGITLIDTADSYGPEVSERLIAEALHPSCGRPRHRHQGRILAPGTQSVGDVRSPRASAGRL